MKSDHGTDIRNIAARDADVAEHLIGQARQLAAGALREGCASQRLAQPSAERSDSGQDAGGGDR